MPQKCPNKNLINTNMKKTLIALAFFARLTLAANFSEAPPSPEVIKNIQEAASQNHPQAEFELGCLLSNGEYLQKDLPEAFNLFLASATQGYPRAQYKVGMAYFNGKGVKKDQKEGLAWVYLAMMAGLPSSVCSSMELSLGNQTTKEAKQRSKELIETLPKDSIEFLSLKTRAPAGDPEVQFKLAMLYSKRKVEPFSLGAAVLQIGGYKDIEPDDVQEAVKWFTKAAEQGYSPAQNELGNWYEMNGGLGRKGGVDARKKAIEWWTRAAKQGYAPSQNNLAGALKSGWMSEIRYHDYKNLKKPLNFFDEDIKSIEREKITAFQLFKSAADQGFALAQKNLGDCYLNGEGVQKDPVEAFGWLKKSAMQGDALAQFAVGELLLKGTGVEKNIPVAISFYEKAFEQGVSKAGTRLGRFYSLGNSVEKDQRKAVQYWEKASGIGGDEVAMRYLGDAYCEGNGVEKDLEKAYMFHRRAGSLGDVLGAVATGDAYSNGFGVDKDIRQAKDWYGSVALNSERQIFPLALEKLSQIGEWSAELVLGLAYLQAKSEKGVHWMKQTASRGSADAKFILASVYYDGELQLKDQVEGLAWMYLAAASEANRQPEINSNDYMRGSNFYNAVMIGKIDFMGNIFKCHEVHEDDLGVLNNNNEYLMKIAKQLSLKWESKIGLQGSLKAQQRAKELAGELVKLQEKPAR